MFIFIPFHNLLKVLRNSYSDDKNREDRFPHRAHEHLRALNEVEERTEDCEEFVDWKWTSRHGSIFSGVTRGLKFDFNFESICYYSRIA